MIRIRTRKAKANTSELLGGNLGIEKFKDM